MKRMNLKQVLMAAALALPFMTFAQFSDNIQYYRYHDQRGINVFESPKTTDVKFEKPVVRFGAGFTQQFQNLKVKNTAINNGGSSVATAGANKLYPITPGFMTAQANLFMDVQLADGIRLDVTTYLSARHHNEAWVKGGYLQFDKLPFKGKVWDDIMKYTTIKLGHMEINYGDAHFRRPDGGQTIYSPFMEGNIMDAFATEIGGEVYVQKSGVFGMIGITNGMIKGSVDTAIQTVQDVNTRRNPSFYFKGGFDKQVTEKVRVRLTGSYYTNSSNAGSGLTLYGGDRTGSNYQNAMEKWVVNGAAQASTAIAFSGRLNPGFSKKINAFMLNGFLKAYGFEFFGTYENAKGRTKTETTERKAEQYAVDGIYRFGKDENLFLGLRYNEVKARLAGFTNDVKVNRFAVAGGWFITRNILMKAEYVIQNYNDFPTSDYRSGGQFKGYVIEAVVGF
jgi:hypothetical protein